MQEGSFSSEIDRIIAITKPHKDKECVFKLFMNFLIKILNYFNKS
jgi:hypothetical protein